MNRCRVALKRKVVYIIMFIMSNTIGINNDKLVFQSWGGKEFSGNPKVIYDEIKYNINLNFIWVTQKNTRNKFSHNHTNIIRYSFLYYFHLATAKFWIDNHPKELYLYKSKKQIYIQTWHADRGFKNIINLIDLKNKSFESNNCDIIITGSEYSVKRLSLAFGYNGLFLNFGTPRCDDIILGKNKQGKINEEYIVLIATTFRKNSLLELEFNIELSKLIKNLKKYLNRNFDSWKIIVKNHINSAFNREFSDPDIIFIDATMEYSNMLLNSSILITDYSSIAGDYLLLEKPIIFFQPDITTYEKYERKLYFNFDNFNSLVAKNVKELLTIIDSVDNEKYLDEYYKFLNSFKLSESGKSTKKIINFINENIKGVYL